MKLRLFVMGIISLGLAFVLFAQTASRPEVPAQSFYTDSYVDEPRVPRYDGPGLNMEILTDIRAVVVTRVLYKSQYITNWIYNTNRIQKPVDTTVKYFRATSTPAGTVWVESSGEGVEFIRNPIMLSPPR